ncbi:heme-dependent oxidative N-demethylase family protein [Acidocella sp.]|uniref:heme-dependent oxidative N-demethylase family protein n=1 Tax=Acidocella sp. TaxID=50710 RepID=UPI003CFC78CF
MDLNLKPAESFREDYSFSNSDEAILRFPFPFPEDTYMYSVNIEPHIRGGETKAFDAVFDLDEHYVGDMADRALVLQQDPLRCQVLPHMMEAQWDTLELLMENLALDYPHHFSLTKNGDHWHWINHPLGIEQSFVFGDPETLPYPPFEYITRQVQGDFSLQDQRDNNLFMDGGMITSQADWSLNFDIGMSFHEWHGPVPVAHEMGVFDRALAFLLRLQHGKPMRRLNWTLTANPRLDTSPENYPLWGPERAAITPQTVGHDMCLRVELQTLTRLSRSNAILFGIRGYLIRLEELVRVRKWAIRMHRVLRDLHPELAEYKGTARYRQMIVDYLAVYDDGRVLNMGIAAEQEAI